MELFRIIEELGERETSLKMELLEQKLLKESAAIVPILEKEIEVRDSNIERFKKKIDCPEMENKRLRSENEFLHTELPKQNKTYEEKIKYMQAELSDIKKAIEEREESSSCSSNQKLIDIISNHCKIHSPRENYGSKLGSQISLEPKFKECICETKIKFWHDIFHIGNSFW